MNKTYRAVYYDSSGRFYNSTIFLSSITLSIRFTNEANELKEVYWLVENISSLEEEALAFVLKHKNKEGQTERLVIRDPELVQAIRKHFSHRRFAGGWKHRLLGSTRNKILLFFSILLFLILAAYFLFIPWLGDRLARNVSKEWEISMGEKMHRSIMYEYKIDSSRTELVNAFFQELRYDSHYPISITVVDSKELNAFSVPGGRVVVYSAILDQLKKPEELVALLSHEMSHIELRHSLRNIFRSVARKVFLMMLIGNESGVTGFLVDNADNLKALEYSRSLETEADNYGIGLMNSANIDPGGMLGLMQILQKQTSEKQPAVFLSTHPVFKNRIENIRNQISKVSIPLVKKDTLELIFKRIKDSGYPTDW